MNNIIYCPDQLPKKNDLWVFLMGPIQGAPDWQSEIENLPEIPNVTFLSPRRKNNPVGSEDLKQVFNDEMYKEQVQWETLGLRYCDLILCWIPSPAETIPGRSYAQTTRFELGENLARGKQFVMGCDPSIPGRRYFIQKFKDYNLPDIKETLEECLEKIKEIAESKKDNRKIWFTSDTHFGSQRALELSRRPFKSVEEMDTVMVENWNRLVGPWDTVYHLGDFGDMKYVKYLNGIKKICLGNYERKEMDEEDWDVKEYSDILSCLGWSRIYNSWEISRIEEDGVTFIFSHFPLKVKYKCLKNDEKFGLFGHIHGRQMIKPWGMDVGVDCHNFCPISMEEIMFYYNAVKDGKYDEEVWS